jgi:hypothetical protein
MYVFAFNNLFSIVHFPYLQTSPTIGIAIKQED